MHLNLQTGPEVGAQSRGLPTAAVAASECHDLTLSRATPLPGAGSEARHQANRFNEILPAWARSEEAIALLEKIVTEQPDRTRVVAETMTGPAMFGFAGKAANRLRQLFDPFIMERMAWSYAAGFDTPLFRKRRAAVLRYADDHGPDALIARVLEAAR